ncbi:alanine racemase [Candidatus Desantisbacteria bacterium]|nr:alanine racemase [Candidatus Desantisbacteria bacterium]
MQPPSWVEVNLDNITHNITEIQRIIGNSCQMMVIVKADAYGHGAVAVAKTAINAGVQRLGVVCLSEGVNLRDAGINCPILSLGPPMPDETQDYIHYRITPSIFSLEQAKAFSEQAVERGISVKIHIKIDTGMGRLGVLYPEAFELIKKIHSLPGIEIEGIFSHLGSSDSACKAYAYEQFRRFTVVINRLKKTGISVPITHIANSGAIIDLLEMRLDMVRPGIAVYGLFPSKSVSQSVSLQPAMSFKTRIIHLKEMPKDLPVQGFLPVYGGISYGRTYVKKKIKVATIPVGYADGYSRALSNKAEVLIQGKRAPIIGRITMNFCMIDVSHIPDVKIGDEVVLFGKQLIAGASMTEEVSLSVDELADICGTISYEILCGINPRILRVYVAEEENK